MSSTIVAVSSPPGMGGIGIVRLSGSEAKAIAACLFKPHSIADFMLAQSRRMYYGKIIDPTSGTTVDEVLCVWMKAPTTYTGEDVVEIQGHGGMIPLREIVRLATANGAVIAEAGEFTKRAFLNGRIDLTQAEAVMDLIQAQSSAAGKTALRQLEGDLGAHIRSLSAAILALLAALEAWIDFGEDIDPFDKPAFETGIKKIEQDINALAASAHRGQIQRLGLQTAIIGMPNVGKSSLLNALLGYDRAIVSEIPGTTLDLLQEQISIEGIAIVLNDTAGLHDSDDPVEVLGIKRSKTALAQADLVLLVLDSSLPLRESEKELLLELQGSRCIIVLNKSDLKAEICQEELCSLVASSTPLIRTVAHKSLGIGELQAAIAAVLIQIMGKTVSGDTVLLTKERHLQAVEATLHFLRDAHSALEDGLPPDIIAIDLRAAWQALAEISGETTSADIVEAIFRDFCIGK